MGRQTLEILLIMSTYLINFIENCHSNCSSWSKGAFKKVNSRLRGGQCWQFEIIMRKSINHGILGTRMSLKYLLEQQFERWCGIFYWIYKFCKESCVFQQLSVVIIVVTNGAGYWELNTSEIIVHWYN
jgi:hypothetical protein